MQISELCSKIADASGVPKKKLMFSSNFDDLTSLISGYSGYGLSPDDRMSINIRFGRGGGFIECGIQGFPGSCGMAVITGLCVPRKYERQGIGSVVLQFMEELAEMLGYSRVVGTDVTEGGIALMKHRGWEEIGEPFNNRRTGNDIYTFAKDIS